eukprot:6175074-Pleurochrysis_carterae.AAC.4
MARARRRVNCYQMSRILFPRVCDHLENPNPMPASYRYYTAWNTDIRAYLLRSSVSVSRLRRKLHYPAPKKSCTVRLCLAQAICA